MKKLLDIDLSPAEYCTHDLLYRAVAHKLHLHVDDISHIEVLRRSLTHAVEYDTMPPLRCTVAKTTSLQTIRDNIATATTAPRSLLSGPVQQGFSLPSVHLKRG